MDDLLRIVEDELGVEVGSLEPETAVNELSEWDSLSVLMIVSRVQEEYGVSLMSEQMAEINNVRDLWQIVQKGAG